MVKLSHIFIYYFAPFARTKVYRQLYILRIFYIETWIVYWSVQYMQHPLGHPPIQPSFLSIAHFQMSSKISFLQVFLNNSFF